MKSTFACAMLLALAPCLLSIERITAAPPAAPPAAPCKECCEGACCKEKAATAKSVASTAVSSCADGQCASETCDCPSKKQVSVDTFLTLPLPPAVSPAISFATTPQACPNSDCGHSGCAGAAAAAAGTTCTEQKTVIYSAVPLGVPSPFAKEPGCASAKRMVFAGQPFAFDVPLPQPPAPISQTSVDAINSCAVEHRLGYAPLATASHSSEAAAKAAQVLYNIEIIQDSEGCLSEYESFRDGDCIMFADSGTLLPALRILQKHDLVSGLSSPKLICAAGQRAQFEIGREVAGEEKTVWEGVKLEVEAEQVQSGLRIDLAVHTSQDEHTCDVRTAVVVEAGKSVVLKSQGARCTKQDSCERAIYVVVTPTIVK